MPRTNTHPIRMLRTAMLTAGAAVALLMAPGPAEAALDCRDCEHVYDNCVRGGGIGECVAQYVDCRQTYCSAAGGFSDLGVVAPARAVQRPAGQSQPKAPMPPVQADVRRNGATR